MVPSVESFQTEFETATARFAQGKALEQGHVPVVAARTTQGVVAQRAPRGRCGGWGLGGARRRRGGVGLVLWFWGGGWGDTRRACRAKGRRHTGRGGGVFVLPVA